MVCFHFHLFVRIFTLNQIIQVLTAAGPPPSPHTKAHTHASHHSKYTHRGTKSNRLQATCALNEASVICHSALFRSQTGTNDSRQARTTKESVSTHRLQGQNTQYNRFVVKFSDSNQMMVKYIILIRLCSVILSRFVKLAKWCAPSPQKRALTVHPQLAQTMKQVQNTISS